MAKKFQTVEEYLASFEPAPPAVLEEVRAAIRAAVPEAEETVSFDMPSYQLHGRPIVHFSGWSSFVSLYPMPVFEPALEKRVRPYRATRGTGRFPLSGPVPTELITEIVGVIAAQALDDS